MKTITALLTLTWIALGNPSLTHADNLTSAEFNSAFKESLAEVKAYRSSWKAQLRVTEIVAETMPIEPPNTPESVNEPQRLTNQQNKLASL